jgi:hypothetical protein
MSPVFFGQSSITADVFSNDAIAQVSYRVGTGRPPYRDFTTNTAASTPSIR